MPRFASQVRTQSPAFAENREGMLQLVERMHELAARAAQVSAKRKPVFDQRGQLLPAERLNRLLDPGMPFFEVGNLAGYCQDDKDPEKTVPGGSVVAGIGFVGGVRCSVVVDDSGINAGAMTMGGGSRLRRCQRIALEQKMPFVHLVESAGANLMHYKVDGFVTGGAMFGNQAQLSAAGVPVITVLHGASTAGGAYMPGMSDYVVAIRGRGKAFLAGPALLKAATGEVATEEELGGAEMHATVSGLAEYLAENDAHGLLLARELVQRLDWNRHCRVQRAQTQGSPPAYDPDEIAGVVPLDYRTPFDAREVVARVVDDSHFSDFKPGFGVSTLCIQASVQGHPVGIVANNGPIDPDGAAKTAQFLQLQDQSDIPLVFLQNTTGYLVGKQYERAGMIKHGSKMIQAVTNVSVPRLSFMIGASFGAGNYGMSGQGFEPDFVVGWPNSRTGVMGGAQAAGTMDMVMREASARRGLEVDEDAMAKQFQRLQQHFDSQESAFYTSGLMLDDGLIDPRHTRQAIGFLLDTCREARDRSVRPNNFGIARM